MTTIGITGAQFVALVMVSGAAVFFVMHLEADTEDLVIKGILASFWILTAVNLWFRASAKRKE